MTSEPTDRQTFEGKKYFGERELFAAGTSNSEEKFMENSSFIKEGR
jgi:hypothetical protein